MRFVMISYPGLPSAVDPIFGSVTKREGVMAAEGINWDWLQAVGFPQRTKVASQVLPEFRSLMSTRI